MTTPSTRMSTARTPSSSRAQPVMAIWPSPALPPPTWPPNCPKGVAAPSGAIDNAIAPSATKKDLDFMGYLLHAYGFFELRFPEITTRRGPNRRILKYYVNFRRFYGHSGPKSIIAHRL